ALAHSIDWNNFNSGLVIEVTRPQGKFTCSGVAVKNNLVLTAAHCLEGEILSVRVFNQSNYDPKAESYKVELYDLHPEYNKDLSNFKYDIARIKLGQNLPESTMIYPIIKNDKDLSGKFLRIGYGARNKSNIRTLITPQFHALRREEKILELD